MRSTADRRIEIRDIISDRRHVTITELCEEFGVCKNTIRADLDAITPTTSFYIKSGKNGGIYATDGWYASHRYLTDEQEEFLKEVMTGLQTDADRKKMESILISFAKPQAKA